MRLLRTHDSSPRYRFMIGCFGTLALLSGCAICPSPYDYDYGGFVEKTPRIDMRDGRVGSLFSDPALTDSTAIETIDGPAMEVLDEEVQRVEIPLEGVEISAPVTLDD
jgi:hypothetical protein